MIVKGARTLFTSYAKAFDDPPRFSLCISFFDIRSFVSNILSSTKSNLNFDAIVIIEVGLEGDHSHSLLFRLLLKFTRLRCMYEQRSRSSLFVLKVRPGHGMFSNMAVHQGASSAILVGFDKGILKIHFPIANRFHFGAHKRDARLERFQDLKVSSGLSIDTNRIVLGFFLLFSRFGEKETGG